MLPAGDKDEVEFHLILVTVTQTPDFAEPLIFYGDLNKGELVGLDLFLMVGCFSIRNRRDNILKSCCILDWHVKRKIPCLVADVIMYYCLVPETSLL